MSKSISPNAYELKVSKIYKRFYRTFSVSLLEPYSRKEGEKPLKPINLEEKDRFQVENIQKKRGSKENPQFLIK
jgi:hypothetical protein